MKPDIARAASAAEQAAYAAGAHLLASRGRLREVLLTRRDPAEVVAEIDREAEAMVQEVLLRHFPDHGFLGRHGEPTRHDGRPVWIVDALDGRANYERDRAEYAVSIALVADGEPLLGVVYDPPRNEFFGALAGRGAVLNGEAIRCDVDSGPMPLAATVFPDPTSPRLPRVMNEVGRVLKTFGNVRRSGSKALEMAQLAAGRIDAWWAHELAPWRTAAGSLLLRESGAWIESRDGEPVLLSGSVMACKPQWHDSFHGVLHDAEAALP